MDESVIEIVPVDLVCVELGSLYGANQNQVHVLPFFDEGCNLQIMAMRWSKLDLNM